MVLAGCVTDAGTTRSGNWLIDQKPDRITGTPVAGAITRVWGATNSNDGVIRNALLQLTCFENRPIAKIAFEFKIGSDRNTSLGYRFDDKPGRDAVESRVLLGYRVIVIEDTAALQQFIDDLRGSTRLYVRIRSLNAGVSSVEFKVAGAEPALEAAYAACPLTTTQARRTT
ncbi:conserved hypothetical protein [Rhodopseudomonas palustris HaA2]|uniref:Uncharacterized protein n=2 Tax=Rhodopseudomonas palustris TaxID=1076 RepID=Q2IYR9_RHOP2|nr:conserved hypothetical protein [Rhodopseudomonas palustris HaA2]